jgi:hypothetical protein
LNSLVRQTYGRAGDRQNRIIVSCHQATAPGHPWLRLFMVLLWGVIAMLFCRFTLPGVNEADTVIDMSKLEIKPIQAMERPIKALQQQDKSPVPPVAKPDEQVEVRPMERLDIPPQKEEIKTTISRPSARQYDEPVVETRIQRERAIRSGEPLAADARIKRETALREMPIEATVERRTRGSVATDLPVNERVASVRRRSSSAEELQPGVQATPRLSTRPNISEKGESLPSAQIRRSSKTTETYAPNVIPRNSRVTAPATSSNGANLPSTRIKRLSKSTETYAQNVIPANDRVKAPAAYGKEVSSSDTKRAVTRGVSLTSLDICSSQQEQEDKIKSVLSVVGSRQNCSDDSGEYQFKGTQRVSSFNLMIYPAKGRKPSNRCEELGNAYRCLKTR